MRYGKLLTIVIILSISFIGCSIDRNNEQNMSAPKHAQAKNERIFILLDSVNDPLPCPQPPSMAVLWPVAVTWQLNNSHPQRHWHL
jgi:hypothetical protein